AQSDGPHERAFLLEERPMKWSMSSVAILVAAVSSVAVGAQSGGTMAKGDKMDRMEMMDANYTGCIEAGSAAGTFMLTHVATADHMGKDIMKKDAMAKDTMTKDAMGEGPHEPRVDGADNTDPDGLVGRPKQAPGPQGVNHWIACAREDGSDGEGHDGQVDSPVHRQVAEDGRGDLLVVLMRQQVRSIQIERSSTW